MKGNFVPPSKSIIVNFNNQESLKVLIEKLSVDNNMKRNRKFPLQDSHLQKTFLYIVNDVTQKLLYLFRIWI